MATKRRGLIDTEAVTKTTMWSCRFTAEESERYEEMLRMFNTDKTTLVRLALDKLWDSVKGKKP